MSYVGYGQSPYLQEPKIRFEAIGEAWGYVRAQMVVWIVTTLIYGIILFGVAIAVQFALAAVGLLPPVGSTGRSSSYIIGNIISGLINLVLGGFLQAGYIRMAIKQTRDQEIQIGDLFSAGDSIGSAVGAQLIYGIATYIGSIFCLIPGIIVTGRGMLAMPIAVDENPGGWQAFNKSWEAMKTQYWNGWALLFVLGLLSVAGILALGVGVLVTAPIVPLTLAIVYRDFFNTERNMAEPRLNVPLPPQSAYGPGRFGDTPNPPAPGRFGDVPSRPLGQNTPPPTTPPSPPGEMPRL